MTSMCRVGVQKNCTSCSSPLSEHNQHVGWWPHFLHSLSLHPGVSWQLKNKFIVNKFVLKILLYLLINHWYSQPGSIGVYHLFIFLWNPGILNDILYLCVCVRACVILHMYLVLKHGCILYLIKQMFAWFLGITRNWPCQMKLSS